MIVKNEERYLRDCLNSVRGIVDDIVLVDTGSTDSTVTIAKEFGARIFNFNWINDFAAARNFALDQTKKGWILYLDADERLSQSSLKEIKKITSCYPGKAFHCLVNNLDQTSNLPSIMLYPRLFPANKAVRFSGKVHEQIEYSLQLNKIPIFSSGIKILHIGYDISKDSLKIKAERNLQLLLSENKDNPSAYVSYQIGQTYGILNDQSAEIYFEEALAKGLERNEYKSVAYRYLAIKKAERNEIIKAEELILLSLSKDKNQPLTLIGASNIYFLKKDFKNASEYILKAYYTNKNILTGKSSSFQNTYLNNDSICTHGLNISLGSGNKELFKFFFNKMKDDNNVIFRLFKNLIDNNYIEPELVDKSVTGLTEKYLDPLMNVLNGYSETESKINIFNALLTKFNNNSKVLISYGILLSETDKLNESVIVLESAMEIDPNNPSIIFYLISVYLRLNKMENVNALLIDSEEQYSNLPAVVSRLRLIRQKLNLN
jgi:glycosyltransferase involved in cell wall biosynthesis